MIPPAPATVEQAQSLLVQALPPPKDEQIEVASALGRVTACDHRSARANPATAVSAMDGYAIRRADLDSTLPCTLPLMSGCNRAGNTQCPKLHQGHAVRIFTGAEVPQGADWIVIQENIRKPHPERIAITNINAEPFIRSAGDDFKKASVIVPKNTLLSVRHLSLLSAANLNAVRVWTQPKAQVISSGDELTPPGSTAALAPTSVPDSNALSLTLCLGLYGAHVEDSITVGDSVAALAAAIAQACASCDLVLCCGGASVGDYDCLRPALDHIGATIEISQIAMRPGKPVVVARKKQTLIVGLPGNPVSAMVTALVLVVPALLAHQNLPHQPQMSAGTLAHNISANGMRQAYLRATLDHIPNQAKPVITVFEQQDSAHLFPLANADALVVRPPQDPERLAGDTLTLYHFPQALVRY